MAAERRYAEGTTVSASRTEAEIKDLLAGRGVRKIIAMNDAEARRRAANRPTTRQLRKTDAAWRDAA